MPDTSIGYRWRALQQQGDILTDTGRAHQRTTFIVFMSLNPKRTMKLKTAADTFMREYFAGRRRVPKTQAAYRTDLDQVCQFAGKASTLSIVTQQFVAKWFKDVKAKGYTPATLRRKVAVLRVFCAFWVQRDYLSESPFWRLKLDIGAIHQPTSVLGAKAILALLTEARSELVAAQKALAQSAGLPRKARDRLRFKVYLAKRNLVIVEVLRATGIRGGELGALNVTDFISNRAFFTISATTTRESRRAYILGRTAPVAIKDYVRSRREVKHKGDAFLLNATGSRLSAQGITNVLRHLCARSGVRQITASSFRHAVETTLLKKGVDLRVVLQVLGKTGSSPDNQKSLAPTRKHIVRELRKAHTSV